MIGRRQGPDHSRAGGRKLRLLLGMAAGLPVLVHAILSGFARRPLSPSESWPFAAAVLRATPAHLGGGDPLETLRLGGAAFGSPAATATIPAEGRSYVIPLPPRTVPAESDPAGRRFITFAAPEERWEYLHSTLPRAGWRYREQFGSMHALVRGDLLLSVQSRFYAGTRVGELRISLRERPPGAR